jgi:transcriptional regulator with XRE-family HTH domain
MRIGRIIHRWRWIEGKSQTSVSKEIGVSKATMSRLEHGKQIDAESLMKVMNWLTANAPNTKDEVPK